MKWTCFSLLCPPAAVEAVVAVMLEAAASGPTVEDADDLRRVCVYVPDGAEAQSCDLELRTMLMRIPTYLTGGGRLELTRQTVRDEDWEHAWKEFYYPFRVGRRLVIKPSWEVWPPADDPNAAGPDDIVIELDPEMAFGTGTHATTQLCLCLLEDLVRPGCLVLDVGCGSGILSLAAAKLGAARVLAVDVDPVAVRTAEENIRRNGAADAVTIARADIEGVEDSGFDIIVANINAPVIRQLIPVAYERLTPGGYCAASGLVEDSVEAVRQSQIAAGFGVVDVRHQEGWAAVVGRKPDRADPHD